MLDRTLSFLLDQLNGYLATRYESNEPHAVLSSLSNLDGTIPAGIENKVVVSLVNIEREPAAVGSAQMRQENGGYSRLSAPLNLNLYVLMSASFGNNYQEALKLLSAVLGYFQGRPVFTAQNTEHPFPAGLERLSVEIVNLDMQSLNHLWGNIGGKYLPSVLYKVRMMTVQNGWIVEQVGPVTGTDAIV